MRVPTTTSELVNTPSHRAQDLLREGKMSVTEIAVELGFSSSQNFAIRFRQETGKSPTEWQRGNV